MRRAKGFWRDGAAVIVGVHTYDHMTDVDSIRNNLLDLHALLTSPNFGIHEDRCFVVDNPTGARSVHDAIEKAVNSGARSIVFYYAGHGVAHGTSGRLLLSLADSRAHAYFTYLKFDDLREQIAESGFDRRLVILDSCYSGAALDTLSLDTSGSLAIKGTYVMASSDATVESAAPPGAQYTTFTGTLLHFLRTGLPGGPKVMDAESLYLAVRGALEERGHAQPVRQARGEGAQLLLLLNPAYVEAPAFSDRSGQPIIPSPATPPEDYFRQHTVPPSSRWTPLRRVAAVLAVLFDIVAAIGFLGPVDGLAPAIIIAGALLFPLSWDALRFDGGSQPSKSNFGWRPASRLAVVTLIHAGCLTLWGLAEDHPPTYETAGAATGSLFVLILCNTLMRIHRKGEPISLSGGSGTPRSLRVVFVSWGSASLACFLFSAFSASGESKEAVAASDTLMNVAFVGGLGLASAYALQSFIYRRLLKGK
ncbi:caspase domain-containing protein [Streptomyces sp. NPDC059256]|uniref:caspase family protein n=1 Tax=Streptomyces sp. NPDC059256 TaxID=3346794 RepID=UPI0036A05364